MRGLTLGRAKSDEKQPVKAEGRAESKARFASIHQPTSDLCTCWAFLVGQLSAYIPSSFLAADVPGIYWVSRQAFLPLPI
jgi:hypothetical protein